MQLGVLFLFQREPLVTLKLPLKTPRLPKKLQTLCTNCLTNETNLHFISIVLQQKMEIILIKTANEVVSDPIPLTAYRIQFVKFLHVQVLLTFYWSWPSVCFQTFTASKENLNIPYCEDQQTFLWRFHTVFSIQHGCQSDKIQ